MKIQKLKEFKRLKDSCAFKYEKQGALANDEVDQKSHEAPIQAFDDEIHKLRSVVATVTGIPEGYFSTATMIGVSFTKNMCCQIHYEVEYEVTETKRVEKTPEPHGSLSLPAPGPSPIGTAAGLPDRSREAPDPELGGKVAPSLLVALLSEDRCVAVV